MARTADTTRAAQQLIRHCHAGLDAAGLQRELLGALRRTFPVDAAFFATADPETLLFTHARAETPLDTATPLFIANEFTGRDVNRFAALATSPRHVATLDAATRADRAASPRYRDIMRPLGLGDELRAALVVGGECWGYLCLHRADGPAGFSATETELLAKIAPHVAHGLRQAVLTRSSAATRTSRQPGVVLLDDDLDLVAMTPEAAQLLDLAGGERLSSLPLPVGLYSAAAALRALEQGTASPLTMPTTRIRTIEGGWLVLHASRLAEPSEQRLITVVVKDAEPANSLSLVLSAHGLTVRECEIANLVLRGTSSRMIATTLQISRYTVQDHITSIFDKTGVRSRAELVGLLLHPPDPAR